MYIYMIPEHGPQTEFFCQLGWPSEAGVSHFAALTSNPEIQLLGAGLRYLGLGT